MSANEPADFFFISLSRARLNVDSGFDSDFPSDFASEALKDLDSESLGNLGDSSLGDKAEAFALALRMKLPNFSLVLIGGGGAFFVRGLGFCFGELEPDSGLHATADAVGV